MCARQEALAPKRSVAPFVRSYSWWPLRSSLSATCLSDGLRRKGFMMQAARWCGSLTIKSILSAPLLGYGYGTFSAVFPMFRDDSIGICGIWDKAHNTYLEIFQGLGLLFGAMLIACVVVLVWDCREGGEDTATRRNHPGDRGKRLFPRGGACSRRLQPAIAGRDVDLHGGSGSRSCAGVRPIARRHCRHSARKLDQRYCSMEDLNHERWI